jgi:TonB-linked SusC/RagA family outer membrane protein
MNLLTSSKQPLFASYSKNISLLLTPQIVKAMKLSFVFLTLFFMHVSAKGVTQNVTLSLKDAPVEKVFREIEKQTGYGFLFSKKMFRNAPKVNIKVTNVPLKEALLYCLKGQPLDYSIENNTIVITQKLVNVVAQEAPSTIRIPITGRVTDKEGNPLAGVSVVVVGTSQGGSTNSNGEFSIAKVDENAKLKFSFVGYTAQTISVNGRSVINISLEVDVKQQSEIVIIGYGSVRQKDLTGSVSVIAAEDIRDVPFTTVDNAIAGKAAGVQVTKSDGTPGGAVRIRVRGSTSLLGGNDPLYVIDGVPVQVQSNFINPGFDVSSPVGNDVTGAGGVSAGMSTAFVNGLNSVGGLNIDDIESITILKDASSTAIYGSKAANGVVIITTKKGKKDMKPQIMVSYYNTVTTPVNPTVLNGDQYKMLLSEAAKNDYDYRTATGRSISPELNAIVNNPGIYFGKSNTDWLDLVTRTTYSNNAEISVQGGGSATKYYSSFSYNSTPGVVNGTDYQRIAGKLNIENEIGSHFRFITNINMGYVNQNITNGAYGQALRARPDYAPYDSAGNFTDFSKIGYSYQGFQNPLAQITATNNSKTLSLLGSISALYDFTPSLQFKSTVSLNMQNYNQRNFTPSYLNIGSFYGNVANNGGIGSNSTSTLNNWFLENTLTYDKTFNEKHALNLLIGTSYETRKVSSFSATATGYPNDDVLNNLSSATTLLRTTGDNPTKPQSYLLSYYARANYGFLDKYLVTFTGRADGSSKFGPNSKFGYFPSGAVAWRVGKENFLKNAGWINEIKIRASYGLTGTQNIGDQMYRTLYSPFSYAGTSALIPTQLGNPGIKWETTKETDLGLDFSFFGNRLQGTVDYYQKLTNGALLSLPVAPSSSYSSLLNNIVNLKNTGYEVSLQGDIIRTKNFRWNASLNITWNKSLVTKLSSDADLSQIGNLTGLEYQNTAIIEGKPLGLITGLKVTGLIKDQKQLDDYKQQLGGYYDYFFQYLSIGDPMFQLDTAANSFGHYVAFNQVIGSAAPKYYGGFTQSVSYKNFDLNLYFTFSQGGQLMWGDNVSSLTFVGTSNANAVMLNRWTPENSNSTQPRLVWQDQALMYNTSLSIFNSSYVKLRTATLNYRFSRSNWMQRVGIINASIFASATNIFTITKYPGNDPETSDDPYSVGGGYFDVSNFPPVKTFSLGLKAGF